MTITVTAIPAGSASNSYANDAQTTAFFADEYIYAKWNAASNADQTRAMKTAAADLDQFIRAYSGKAILNQAMAWPWHNGADDVDAFISTQSPDAGAGTLVSVAIDNLKNKIYPDDWFNLGSLFVDSTSDNAAPMTELRAVSDYVRSTGVLTTAAFSVAIPDGASLWLIRPAPQWLIDAQCLQAFFVLQDIRTKTGADINAGIQSRNAQQGGSISYRALNTIDMAAQGLDNKVKELIDVHLPRSKRYERGG